jgi:geranylgeranyl diphosphate synthase, type I
VNNPVVSDLFAATYDFILETFLPPFGWSEFEAILRAYQAKRNSSPCACVDVLPLLACAAAGGNPDQIYPLAAAWVLYTLAGRIFDDLQDGEGRDHLWNHDGLKSAMPIGLFAIGTAPAALVHLPVSSDTKQEIGATFSHVLALSAAAQSKRPTLEHLSIEWYFKNIAAKTGLVFATATWAGGKLAQPEPTGKALDALYQYGLNAGMMGQIADDCRDLATADLRAGIFTLPVIYALTQEDHQDHARLKELLAVTTPQPDRIAAILSILQKMDAINWSLNVAGMYQNQAIAALDSLPTERVSLLLNYVTSNSYLPS